MTRKRKIHRIIGTTTIVLGDPVYTLCGRKARGRWPEHGPGLVLDFGNFDASPAQNLVTCKRCIAA